jgi:hypothetical protein
MTDSLDALIQDALFTRLKTPALTSPETPIAWPLVAFIPPASGAYLDARPIMRAETDKPWIAFDSSQVHRGIFQVDAVVPNTGGERAGLNLAALVAARFATGTMIDIAGGYRLKIIDAVSIGTVVPDSPWARYPVSIPYFIVVD